MALRLLLLPALCSLFDQHSLRCLTLTSVCERLLLCINSFALSHRCCGPDWQTRLRPSLVALGFCVYELLFH